MISAFANSMKVPELRRRILFTLAMIVVVRLGVQIPLPGIDVMELQKVIEASANASGPGAGLATVLTIFSGGGLQQCGIFALGIMPYISASIMTQLLSAVVPQWAKMVREEGGRQKMTKWTRAIAIVIALDENSVIFTIVSFAWAGFGATFGPLMLFSLFWKRMNRAGAIAGMISGGAMVFV